MQTPPLHVFNDPLFQAMDRGDVLWGDLLCEETPLSVAEFGAVAAAWEAEKAARVQAEVDDSERQGAALFDQPFASNLDWSFADIYNTTRLTDEEWVACMTWLYDQGWEIVGEDRNGFDGWPADLPPRVWVAPHIPSRFDALSSAPAVRAPRARVTVPRFCRDSRGGVACADPACRYVHADTIPCVDKCCGFDGRCSGDKRLTCIYMHPSEGQTWSADLVVTRP